MREDKFSLIPAGTYVLGSNNFYPEEAPQFEHSISEFWMSRTPVTNSEFLEFVNQTGYVTTAELPPAEDVNASPGSLLFRETPGPVNLNDWRQWWEWVPGITWRNPQGLETPIDQFLNHPVTHVSYVDAQAYCEWAQVCLPTEEEWEIAARGGLQNESFSWGSTNQTPRNLMANTWQGSFPWRNTGALGWHRTSPVGIFPPNGYGLFDVPGNVWEWTRTPWVSSHDSAVQAQVQKCSCGCSPVSSGEMMTVKGGSHLCSIEYCFRYRPAARSSQSVSATTSHLGFRIVKYQ